MPKKIRRTMTPITSSEELAAEIEKAGTAFLGTFLEELLDNCEQFQTKELKNQYIDFFYNCCWDGSGTRKELTEKINAAIRIIESGMTDEILDCLISSGVLNSSEKASLAALFPLIKG